MAPLRLCHADGVVKRRFVEASATRIAGPWTHRDISANGIRLHVAEAGAGPLVVLLHGFPQFWWSFRHQLVALSAAGFHAVAPDLRGYGASDKPPRGYDSYTIAGDVIGLIRALGEQEAVLVGAGWGGLIALTVARLHTSSVRRLALLGSAHPLAIRSLAAARPGRAGRSSGYLLRFQLPWLPERWLVASDAVNVARLLAAWGGPGYPDPDAARRYRDAMQIIYAPNRALEYYRWLLRSQLRPDGHRYARLMAEPVATPTLQIHGELDGALSSQLARATSRYVRGDYTFLPLADTGHFVHEEAADQVSGELIAWAKQG